VGPSRERVCSCGADSPLSNPLPMHRQRAGKKLSSCPDRSRRSGEDTEGAVRQRLHGDRPCSFSPRYRETRPMEHQRKPRPRRTCRCATCRPWRCFQRCIQPPAPTPRLSVAPDRWRSCHPGAHPLRRRSTLDIPSRSATCSTMKLGGEQRLRGAETRGTLRWAGCWWRRRGADADVGASIGPGA